MVVKRGRYERTGGDRDVTMDQNKMDRGHKTNDECLNGKKNKANWAFATAQSSWKGKRTRRGPRRSIFVIIFQQMDGRGDYGHTKTIK